MIDQRLTPTSGRGTSRSAGGCHPVTNHQHAVEELTPVVPSEREVKAGQVLL